MSSNTFSYSYSAKENKEVQEIRRRYLPQTETKLEEMKRLDGYVQKSGMVESLCAGILGLLIFGVGMCCVLQVFGSGVFFTVLGVWAGIIGAVVMGFAYPIYRKQFHKAKEKYSPRILELAEELSGDMSSAS